MTWWQTLHQDGTVFNRKLDVAVLRASDAAYARALGLRVHAAYATLVTRGMQLPELEEGYEERELQPRDRTTRRGRQELETV